jgi:hypothetical protein
MEQKETYGTSFVRHLAAIGRQTPFLYKDLQQIKAMSQAELADRMKIECPEFSKIVLSQTPEQAAERVHQRRMEIATAVGSVQQVETKFALLEVLVRLFAVSH